MTFKNPIVGFYRSQSNYFNIKTAANINYKIPIGSTPVQLNNSDRVNLDNDIRAVQVLVQRHLLLSGLIPSTYDYSNDDNLTYLYFVNGY